MGKDILVGEEAGISEVGERVDGDGMVVQGHVHEQGVLIQFLCLCFAKQQQRHKYEDKCLFHGSGV